MFSRFWTSKCGCIVLKALEKSKNISLTVLPVFAKCEYIFYKLYRTTSSLLLFFCRQIVVVSIIFRKFFPIDRGPRVYILWSQDSKRYKAKIVHGWYHSRSFRYRHNACSLPSSWNSIAEKHALNVMQENASKLFSACLKYLCSVPFAQPIFFLIILLELEVSSCLWCL